MEILFFPFQKKNYTLLLIVFLPWREAANQEATEFSNHDACECDCSQITPCATPVSFLSSVPSRTGAGATCCELASVKPSLPCPFDAARALLGRSRDKVKLASPRLFLGSCLGTRPPLLVGFFVPPSRVFVFATGLCWRLDPQLAWNQVLCGFSLEP
jgi:hypothetical protein